ncbi:MULTISPECIES: Nudix hydrolase [unclassified Methanosarcina]|uniref:Nudix hydrolase n=1 Tax=unclassified Methanosarcina TaxID=2644672 RepID=UPI000615F402|nr:MULTISPECIES: Nudix hydrolase [unclassified Methanosarcina]AKB20107.1 MutT protein [Methanosarcina sp. WWM596]AKB21675.1 MutT protein [Methanosarcina sp. WH1]
MTELIIEVDRDDNFLGLRPREDFYSENHIHRASHLILLDPENRMLLQKRAPEKYWYPNRYTYSVSGTVANESYETCIAREMLEEIGISVPFRKLFKIPCILENKGAYHTVFSGRCSKETAGLIRHDPEEAVSVEWVELEELNRAVKTVPGNYTPSLRAGIIKIFEEGCGKYLF